MTARLGVLTIGESPRDDLLPEMRAHLGVPVTEAGALDGLGAGWLARLRPEGDDEVLVTRLGDGTSVQVGRSRIAPLVQERIEALEAAGVAATLLVCTGTFAAFRHRRPLLHADRLLHAAVGAAAEDTCLGVVCPSPDQLAATSQRWAGMAKATAVAAASPYEAASPVTEAARGLAAGGAALVVLDCMGFTEGHARAARAASGRPVVLARSAVARVAGAWLRAAPAGEEG